MQGESGIKTKARFNWWCHLLSEGGFLICICHHGMFHFFYCYHQWLFCWDINLLSWRCLWKKKKWDGYELWKLISENRKSLGFCLSLCVKTDYTIGILECFISAIYFFLLWLLDTFLLSLFFSQPVHYRPFNTHKMLLLWFQKMLLFPSVYLPCMCLGGLLFLSIHQTQNKATHTLLCLEYVLIMH